MKIGALCLLRDISERINILLGKVTYMEAKVQDLVDRVNAQSTVVASVLTLLGDLKTQLEAAKDDPAVLDAAIATLDANSAALADAVAANTAAANEPAAPEPAPGDPV